MICKRNGYLGNQRSLSGSNYRIEKAKYTLLVPIYKSLTIETLTSAREYFKRTDFNQEIKKEATQVKNIVNTFIEKCSSCKSGYQNQSITNL